MANLYYKVVKGDTLSKIASKYKTTTSKLISWNHLQKTYPTGFIVFVGQVLVVGSDDGKEPTCLKTITTTNSKKAIIDAWGLQSDTDRTVFATWAWDKSNTDHYQTRWYYRTGDNVWFVGDDSTTEFKQSLYTAPTNALGVKFFVKPIAKTHKVNDKDVSYWTAEWSDRKQYSFSNNPPTTPDVPTVTINENLKLTVELDNLSVNASSIEFQVVQDNSKVVKTGLSAITKSHAAFSCSVSAGHRYKVRCRSQQSNHIDCSDWSDYSDNIETAPAASAGIYDIHALSETSVYLHWYHATGATGYVVEYTTKYDYFDSSPSNVSSVTITGVRHAEITGLESGQSWVFRVKATNDQGESAWTGAKSIKLGKAPSAPTTWSSTTTVIAGEKLTLYWVHNSEDGSSQTYAKLLLTINGTSTTKYIQNSTDEDEKDKTSSYEFDTSGYSEGSTLKWKVATRGVVETYSDWSIERTVDIYGAPTLELNMTDIDGNALTELTSFPFYISGVAGPNTQTPVSYHVSIVANETYETVNSIGNIETISSGQEIYSKNFDTSSELLVEFTPGNINLDNNISYTVICTVSMDSGLTAESSIDFTVTWADNLYPPNAEITVDRDTATASIRPYCAYEPSSFRIVSYSNGLYKVTDEETTDLQGAMVIDANTTTGEQVYTSTDDSGSTVYYCLVIEAETLADDITLSVYRREFDGTLTELLTGIDNQSNTYITDPHPSLDYARYRVVAISNSTGAVSYYDVPGYPINIKSVIIQWDETWTSFDTNNEDALEQPVWSGSMLVLPYNIDVSDNYSADVSLIEYIGREHPVSYYGTQLGETATWSVDIDKTDKDTLYAIRRLAIWMGDVYVREPSGSGYWANVKVSFSQTHCETVIPVQFSITRVEGQDSAYYKLYSYLENKVYY